MRAAPNILLIDDDRAWLDTLSDFLEGKGYRVGTAQGGRHGLSLLQSVEPSLVIVDFHMPEMNGLELLRRLRRNGRELAVLMLSSDDDPELPNRALAEGAGAFLSKTLPPSALLHALLQTVSALGSAASVEPLHWERLLPVPRQRKLYLPIPLSLLRPHNN